MSRAQVKIIINRRSIIVPVDNLLADRVIEQRDNAGLDLSKLSEEVERALQAVLSRKYAPPTARQLRMVGRIERALKVSAPSNAKLWKDAASRFIEQNLPMLEQQP